MTRRMLSQLVNALTHEWRGDVHFHAHAGRPYPCYDDRCTSPRLDAG
jgi:hypothetical protein